MKNLFLSAAIVLGGFASFAANFTDSTVESNTIEKSISIGDEYTEIKVTELPTAVTDALKKAHSDAVIAKAFKNEKSEYKLEVTVGGKTETLYANADGTWIK